MARLKQFFLLLWKNFKLQLRHPWVTLFELGVPTVFCIILVFIRTTVDAEYISNPTIYQPFSIDHFPGNVTLSNMRFSFRSEINKVLYAPNAVHVQSMMNKVGRHLGISVAGFTSEDQMVDSYFDSPSQASIIAGVVFDSETKADSMFSNHISYTVRPKGLPAIIESEKDNIVPTWHTLNTFPMFQVLGPRNKDSAWGGSPGYMSQGFLTLQHAIAMGIIEAIEGNETLNTDLFELVMQRFPYPPYYDDKFLLALQFFFPVILMISFIYPSLNIVKNIVAEKERKLKEAMKMMGLSNWMHWWAWSLKYFLFLAISAGIITALLSVKFQGSVAILNHSDPSVIFVLLLVYEACTISFCSFISVFFSNANSAAAGTGIIFFLTFVPYFFLFPRFNEISLSGKLGAALLSNTALSMSSMILTMWEGTGAGVQWETLSTPPSPDNPLTMSLIFMMLIIDGIIYAVLTWYIEAVFPGEYGVPEPWYFPFKPTYWCRIPPTLNNVSQLFNSGVKRIYFESEPTDLMAGIQIQGLTKIYNKQDPPAVNNININMYRSHITVLLGHNGAGKSTAISMLTGLFPPTSGTASVNGFDICEDIDGVHSCLGICPQHDVLFDDLTVEEHLYFFCKLKGYIPTLVQSEVDRIVAAVGLEDKRTALSMTLSGGMKRKLSVGIALIGGSQIVVLDEPTSGMDPSARRFIWDVLQSEKEDRTILLTTHFMEEADILGDRIAIMAEGEIQCCGSPLFLKKKYGAGYHLVMVKQASCDVDFITRLIHTYLPTAEMSSNVGSELSYILPHDGCNVFEKLFTEIENRKDELKISSYGASITTMEEVFIKVGQKLIIERSRTRPSTRPPDHSEPVINSEVNMVNVGIVASTGEVLFPVEEDECGHGKNSGSILFLQQFAALLLKRVLFSLRNLLLTLSQLILPPLFLTITLFVIKALPKPEDAPSLELNLDPFHTTNIPFSIKDETLVELNMSETFLSQFGHDLNKPILVEKNESLIDYLIKVGEQDIAEFNLHNIIAASFTHNATDNRTLLKSLFNNQAYHSPAIALFSIDNMLLKYFTKNDTYSLSVFNHPLPRTLSEKGKQQQYQATEAYQMAQDLMFGMSFLMASFAVFLVKENISKSKHLQRVSGVNLITFWLATFLWDFFNYMIPCIFVLFVFKAFGTDGMSSSEEQGRLLLLFFIHGLSALPFIYCTAFLFVLPSTAYVRLCLFNIVGGIACLLTVTIMEIPTLNVMEISKHLDLTFSILLPNYCLGRSVSNLFQNHQVTEVCSKFEVLCQFNSSFFDQIKPCCHGKCGNECLPWEKHFLSLNNPGIGRQLIFLAAQSLFFFGLLTVCELKLLRYVKYRLSGHKIKPIVEEATDLTSETVEDDDVMIERQTIQTSDLSELFLSNRLILKQLTKDYGSMLAVNKLSFGVRKGECFGLLGLNGAGKTTTFQMITGDEAITSGDVFLDGFSVRKATRKVQRRLGYCPQFDALIDQLTGRETLTMYARLRGLQESTISDQVINLSNMLTFGMHIDKQVKQYSGGNKRKLSTAIALLGNPPVIFLDEPTTGMDPVSRHNVWDVLLQVLKSGRSIVLTSHSMEECEALCNRLVIMVNGKLCCMGSPQHLKNKFGQGFTLIIKVQRHSLAEMQQKLSVEISSDSVLNILQASSIDMTNIFNLNEASIFKINVEQVKQFVERTFTGSILKDIHEGFLHYHIPNPKLGWAQIFGAMEQARTELNIEDYSVGQTSLEQVFLNFARTQRIGKEF